MSDEPLPASTNRELTAEIVAAYVRRNQIVAEQLGTVISTVHQALSDLGKPAAEAVVERTPAVSIRRSVQRDYVVCIECGWRGKMVRRHLGTAHRLTVDAYRARWNLSRDHAMVAPAYSARRSGLAKELGLGRHGRASAEVAMVPEAETATAPQPSRKRRGQPRSKATTASPA
jgi:MucR family transcriptional regulator, transcriptional regulator of exopolysaccharide biosynthesis